MASTLWTPLDARPDSESAHGISDDNRASQTCPSWQAAGLAAGVTCVVVLGLFWPTVRTMIDTWAHFRTFAHGFLVTPAVLYLIWCYRGRLASVLPKPTRWAWLFLGAMGGGWLLGRKTDTVVLEQFAVVAMLPGIVWATLGTAVLRTLSYPLGFLIFAVPIGTSIEPWLQGFTAAFIVGGLHLVQVPVHWDATFITIPSRTWEVARDCGGLRYVLPGMALGYLFAGVLYQSGLRRLAFLVVCLILLILANGVRALGVVLGDHLGIAEGVDHRFFSYSIYGATVVFMVWAGLKWREWKQEAPRFVGRRTTEQGKDGPRVITTTTAALGALAVLALAPFVAWLLDASR